MDDPSANAASSEPLGRAAKDSLQELLRAGVIEVADKPEAYRLVLASRSAIEAALAPLDLALRLDEIRGLAFLIVHPDFVAAGDDREQWSHPLIRRQRLNLEQSLLVAILRQRFLAHEQEAGTGNTDALVHLDQLLPDVLHFLGDKGSDQQNENRLRTLLEQLRGHGLVSDIDANEQLRIRPLIVHLANPANLEALIATFRDQAATSTP